MRELFTDARGRHQGASIPPTRIQPEFVAALKLRVREMLPAAIAALAERTPQILLLAVSDLETPRTAFGRVVLMGGGFVARPHTAAGFSKAARMAFGRRLCAHSHHLGTHLEG